MILKIAILLTVLGLVAGDIYPAPGYATHSVPPAITSQSANILRSYGNLGQVSTYSKSVDTPYSSVSKSDIRFSNPSGVTTYVSPAPVHEVPAAYHHHIPLPAATAYHAPVAAPAPGQPLLGVAFSAAPAVSHMSFDGYGIQYTY